jgi:hypothetical protein
MAFITEWLSQQQQAGVADMVLDDTLADLTRRSGLLDTYMPLETYESRHFLKYVVDRVNPMASIIAPGVEPPLSRSGNFRKIIAEMSKTGLAHLYDEEYQWQMQEAMDQAKMKNLTVQSYATADGSIVRGTNDTLAKMIFGTIESIARAQVERMNFLTWQLVQFGQINYTDSRTQQTMAIDFADPNATYNHFPAALVGGALWNVYATANGLQDLEDSMETYIDTNGFAPDSIVMSRKLYRHLLAQESTKNAATQVRGASVGTVSPDLLQAVLEARGLPGIKTFDEQTEEVLQDHSIQNVRFLNTDRFVFLKEKMGQRAMGPTMESGGRSGVYVVTREISQFPSVDATQAVSNMAIVPNNIKLFYSRKVV